MSNGNSPDTGGQRPSGRPVRLQLVRADHEPPAFLALSRGMARSVSTVGLVCILLGHGGRVLFADAAMPGWLLLVDVCGLGMLLLMFLDGRSPYRRETPRDEREQAQWLDTVRRSFLLMLGFLFLLYVASGVARWTGWQPGRHIVGDLLMLITQISVMLPLVVAAWTAPPLPDGDEDDA